MIEGEINDSKTRIKEVKENILQRSVILAEIKKPTF